MQSFFFFHLSLSLSHSSHPRSISPINRLLGRSRSEQGPGLIEWRELKEAMHVRLSKRGTRQRYYAHVTVDNNY